MTEVAWSRLEALLSTEQRVGRPYDYERRLVFDAILYIQQSDCGWQNVPSHFPPWQTVYAQLRQWRKTGMWDTIWLGLNKLYSTDELQL